MKRFTSLFLKLFPMSEKLYKTGDLVPKAGRYQCTVCGLIVEYLEKHIEMGITFAECTLCKAGTAGGPKDLHEDFWKAV